MIRPALSRLNLARALKVAALLLFFLPWATVSCSSGALGDAAGFQITGAPSETLARPTGFALAAGRARFLQAPPAAEARAPANPFARPDPLVILAAALIAIALVLTFLRKGRAPILVASGATLLAAGLLCFALFVRLPRIAQDYVLALVAREGDNTQAVDPQKLVQMIQVRPEPGFWLTLAALAAAAVLLFLAARKEG